MSRDWSEEYLDENCCLKIFIGQLEKQLKIATKALKSIKHKIDDLCDFLDTHEFSVEDMLAVVCAHLLRYKDTEFNT